MRVGRPGTLLSTAALLVVALAASGPAAAQQADEGNGGWVGHDSAGPSGGSGGQATPAGNSTGSGSGAAAGNQGDRAPSGFTYYDVGLSQDDEGNDCWLVEATGGHATPASQYQTYDHAAGQVDDFDHNGTLHDACPPAQNGAPPGVGATHDRCHQSSDLREVVEEVPPSPRGRPRRRHGRCAPLVGGHARPRSPCCSGWPTRIGAWVLPSRRTAVPPGPVLP